MKTIHKEEFVMQSNVSLREQLRVVANQLEQDIYVAVDAGSTGTRVTFFDESVSQDMLDKLAHHSVPSRFGVFEPTGKSIKPEGDSIDDNLYIILEKYPLNNLQKPMIVHHMLFGSIRDREFCTELAVNSSISKATSEVTVYNTIGATAIGLFKEIEDNNLPNHLITDLHLISSLRPKDMAVDSFVETYKDNMQSTYIVKYPFKGYEVKINVRRENIEVVSEPAANMIFTKFKYKDKKFENLVLIDGGGSSIDGVVAKGKQIFASKSDNATIGGEDIKSQFTQLAISQLGFPLTEEQTSSMLYKGYFIRSGKKYKCEALVRMLNNQIAEKSMQEVYKQAQANNMTINGLDAICINGRLYRSQLEDESIKPELLIKEKAQAQNKDIQVIYNDDEFAITKGLVLKAMKRFSK